MLQAFLHRRVCPRHPPLVNLSLWDLETRVYHRFLFTDSANVNDLSFFCLAISIAAGRVQKGVNLTTDLGGNAGKEDYERVRKQWVQKGEKETGDRRYVSGADWFCSPSCLCTPYFALFQANSKNPDLHSPKLDFPHGRCRWHLPPQALRS